MVALERDFDTVALRRVLGAFATGVTVITTVGEDGQYYGITANSFSSVSLEPPLVLWSQALTSPSYAAFRDATHFGISILSEGQIDISNRFAKSGPGKFDGVPVRTGIGGVPLIEGAAAFLECEREASYPGGDHTVFIARVRRIDQHQVGPLVFASGKYMVAAHHDLRRSSDGLGVSSLSHLNGIRLASAAAHDLAASLNHTVGVGVWGNHGPTIVRWEESRTPVSINLRTGMVLPIFGSATGLALAAFLPDDVTGQQIDSELRTAGQTDAVAGQAVARDLLQAVRRAGFAELIAGDNFTELYGTQVNAVSVPVFDRNGTVVLAMTALGHARETSRAWRDDTLAALSASAAEISAKLGFMAEQRS
jgi:flavin reductase (DIM6/NTAB) family NADH-FMN oxidoreductase RutF/DNA-binding IclR family transcriptional regulator